MDEAFLHFVWKFQKFHSQNLITATGEQLHIFQPGIHNHDSGPDFSESRIKIGDLEWSGHVEIHIKSSDWEHHGHSNDVAYDNVILHVVWQHDKEIARMNGSLIPTLELNKLVDQQLIIDYKNYLSQPEDILCHAHLKNLPDLIWNTNLDAMLARRLEQKAERILKKAKELNYDWEELAYITLSRNFGFSLNAEAFERLADSLPLKFIHKHSDQPIQIQAMLFGQAGFLDGINDDFQKELSTEYSFLKSKYQLDGFHRAHWKFGKMRPTNFPSVRLIQLSGILQKTTKLFSTFSELSSLRELKRIFQLDLSDYWSDHYDFGKPLKRGTNQIGIKSVENLIINSVVPIMAAYSIHTDQPGMMDKAITFLEQLPAEFNRYTRKFEQHGRTPSSAFDSQALITLYKDFCSRKKCLNCAVGTAIFQS